MIMGVSNDKGGRASSGGAWASTCESGRGCPDMEERGTSTSGSGQAGASSGGFGGAETSQMGKEMWWS